MKTNRCYSDLQNLSTFEERYEYLRLDGHVGHVTFGSERYMNQKFYNSHEWKRSRDIVIFRDNGCDLGIEGREIHSRIYIHHINPIGPKDLELRTPALLDPENLITVTHQTHNAIHYGNADNLQKDLVERRPGDTKDW